MIKDVSLNDVHNREHCNSKAYNNKPLIFTNKRSGTYLTHTFKVFNFSSQILFVNLES